MSHEVGPVLLQNALKFHVLLLRPCPSDLGDNFNGLVLVPQWDEGRWTSILYPDLCKTFVPASHNILVSKLELMVGPLAG